MSQTYSRYSTHDFERRWRKRLDTPLRWTTAQLQVEVTHRFPPAEPVWLATPTCGRPSRGPITSSVFIVGGSQSAGKLALKQFSTAT